MNTPFQENCSFHCFDALRSIVRWRRTAKTITATEKREERRNQIKKLSINEKIIIAKSIE